MAQQIFAPGFMVIHGNRAEDLCSIATDWMTQNPLAPLEKEIILVQSNGIAHWLRQEIAKTGIAAALDFMLPASFIWQTYKNVLGPDLVPDVSPLNKDSLAWRLLRILKDDTPSDPLLQSFLADADIRKYYQLSMRLADLFDQYQVYRADWLTAWQNQRDILLNNQGQELPLNQDQDWQPGLWRQILQDVQTSHNHAAGRAVIHQAFINKLSQPDMDLSAIKLPRRVIVFGISSMPKQLLEALVALAQSVQIIVFVNNPCEHYWGDIQGAQDILRSNFRRQSKKPGVPELLSAEELHNYVQPLLASWGRLGRDFISLLDEYDSAESVQFGQHSLATISSKINVFQPLDGANLLQRLQDDIRDLRPISASQQKWSDIPAKPDQSIRMHMAYSKQRELEILHDQLLDTFVNNPGLNPGDIIVMVPNIEDYAPHIQAVFGLYDRTDPRYLPYTIVDREKRHADPLVIALEQLLSLPDLRFGVQEILDLLDVAAIQARFGLDADSIASISVWVEQANIRWGLDSTQKSAYLGSTSSNTNSWDFGLLRMLLGYARGLQSGTWHDIEPYPEIGGIQAADLGSLVRFLSKLEQYWQLLNAERSPSQWLNIINNLLDDFFLPQTASDENSILRLRQIIQNWGDICADVGLDMALPIQLIANHALSQLDDASLSQKFFAGAITFATLMPMRAIPFKHICLLGMQDGNFPRVRTPDDFDLMSLYPRPGDRSRREDDRYLFLEALLSARDSLYISWIGRDIKDNSEQPPSVLVAQLIDHINLAYGAGENLGTQLITEHPLQAFSKKYYQGVDGLFTYANQWRVANDSAPVITATAGDVIMPSRLDLDQLKQFLKDPVAYFYKNRLGIYFQSSEQALSENESYVIDGLGRWGLRDRLLAAFTQRGEIDDVHAVLQQLTASGDLPGDNFGNYLAHEFLADLQDVFNQYKNFYSNYPDKLDTVSISSTINNINFNARLKNIYQNSTGIKCNLVLQASNIVKDKKYRYGAIVPHWLDHLAANVFGHAVNTVVISPVGNLYLETMPPDAAQAIWDKLWAAYFTGLEKPLPVQIDTAYTWLQQNQENMDLAYAKTKETFDKYMSHNYYLGRNFGSFEQLFADPGFNEWAHTLYGDIADYMVQQDEL